MLIEERYNTLHCQTKCLAEWPDITAHVGPRAILHEHQFSAVLHDCTHLARQLQTVTICQSGGSLSVNRHFPNNNHGNMKCSNAERRRKKDRGREREFCNCKLKDPVEKWVGPTRCRSKSWTLGWHWQELLLPPVQHDCMYSLPCYTRQLRPRR